MITTGQIRAVNPLQLARISGVTKIPRYAGSPIPPVIRPNLLTTQLQGCDHCGALHGLPPDYGTLRGLGDVATTADIIGASVEQNLPATIPGTNVDLSFPSAGKPGVQSVLNAVALGVSFIPGIGPIAGPAIASMGQAIQQMAKWLGIGAGRKEADLIVPIQNNLMSQLGTVTQQFLTGTSISAAQLITLYREVWILGTAFTEFVLQTAFTDRRASGQALNTIRPYIDGYCGYAVPLGPTANHGAANCLSWGDGSLGGAGTNGMLGALARAITKAGGTPPVYPDIDNAANNGVPVSSTQPLVAGTTPGPFSSLFAGTTLMGSPIFLAGAAVVLYALFFGGGGGGYRSRKVVTTDIF